jgi:uncharacterized membrane protein YkoI
MGTFQHGVAALALGAALLAGGVAGASAQDDEGPNEVESPVRPATLDDGAELLPQAGISLEEAIAAAQGAAPGAVGEVDLEYAAGTLVFNVDVGDQDVHVDAASGAVVSVNADD